MTKTEQNEAAAQHCIDLFNQRTTVWVESCYASNADWIELTPAPSL